MGAVKFTEKDKTCSKLRY